MVDKTYSKSFLNSPINSDDLEKELLEDLKSAEMYQLQNDAKIRAVQQGVPTYEDFRQMVNGAHLKPLERTDRKPAGPILNPIIHRDRLNGFDRFVKESSTVDKFDKHLRSIPEPARNFVKSWMRLESVEAKLLHLWTTRDSLKDHIFHPEIPSIFLREFIDVCYRNIGNSDNVKLIIDVLQVLSTCHRFHLTVSLMSKEEKIQCNDVFDQLMKYPIDRDNVVSLRKSYTEI